MTGPPRVEPEVIELAEAHGRPWVVGGTSDEAFPEVLAIAHELLTDCYRRELPESGFGLTFDGKVVRIAVANGEATYERLRDVPSDHMTLFLRVGEPVGFSPFLREQ